QLRSDGFLVGQVEQGQTNTYILHVTDFDFQVKLTLVWDDPPGAENAATTLVNDLDLVVFDPANNRAFPWTLNPANPAAEAVRTREDHINNIEQVSVEANIISGDWIVQVVGKNVPVDAPQKYSLIFTPSTIPAPPNLVIESATFMESSSGGANQDGSIDPGETIFETVAIRNTDGQ